MDTRFYVESNRPPERLNLHVSTVSLLPTLYTNAFNDPNWQNAMHDEYNALIKNNTWTLVPQPINANIVHRMPVSKASQGDAKNSPHAKEDTNTAVDQPCESTMATMDDLPFNNGKSKIIQDNIGFGQLKNNMDRLIEEDKVLDINTVQPEVKKQVTGSLWERFKEVKKVSTSKPHSSMSDTDDDSEVEEVYSPGYDKSNYIASTSGEFTMEDDDLDCYDGYEAHIYDLPNDMQNLCDLYDIRLKSHVRK
ncbi:ribonuclease H-like domain-containing protein [Tanacetum coccineum]